MITVVKRIAVGFALTLFGISVALVIVEIAFRLWNPQQVATEGWSDRPRFYYLPENARSKQGPGYTREKPADTFRIAVVGDSFAFAPYMQFDDTFAARLERMLNLNTTGRRAEVINYGVPRYSTHHEVGVVQRALADGADLIVLQITLNDPEIKPYHPTGLIVGEVNRWGQLELEGAIFKYWRSLGYVVTRIYNSQTPNKYREYFFNLFDKPRTFKNFRDSVGSIARAASAKKVPVIAVTFPLFGVPLDESYPFLPIHTKVAEVLSEVAVPNLDLFATYKGIPHDRLKVMPLRDFHPNEIAHRMAAEELYLFLREHKLIPEELTIKRSYPDRIDIRLPEGETEGSS